MELNAENVKQMINQQTAANNAWSAEQAQKQMDFQKEMSNTAHQREVADLKAAGLNPVLSASHQGASSAIGASADPDQSGNSALVSFLGNLVQTQNQLELQKNNAELQRELTEKTNAVTAMIAELNRQVNLETSNIAARASEYAASAAAGASMYGADQANWREWYSQGQQSARQSMAQAHESAILASKQSQERFMANNYPTTPTQAAAGSLYSKTSLGSTLQSYDNMIANNSAAAAAKSIVKTVLSGVGRGLGGKSNKGSGFGRR